MSEDTPEYQAEQKKKRRANYRIIESLEARLDATKALLNLFQIASALGAGTSIVLLVLMFWPVS